MSAKGQQGTLREVAPVLSSVLLMISLKDSLDQLSERSEITLAWR
jgi:hypothetical protein